MQTMYREVGLFGASVWEAGSRADGAGIPQRIKKACQRTSQFSLWMTARRFVR